MDVRRANGRVPPTNDVAVDGALPLAADDAAPAPIVLDAPIIPVLSARFAPPSTGAAIAPNGIGRSAVPRALPANAAVEAARTLVGGLERQIVRLENENLVRTREIDRLVGEIAARQQEIQRAYENKRTVGIVAALFGAPMVGLASLVMMQRDDARLRELDASLTRARTDQATAQTEVAQYRAMKDRVSKSLADLQRAEVSLSTGITTLDVPKRLEKLADAVETFSRSQLLLANLEAQISILTEIRDAAADLGLHLESILGDLRRAADRARADVAASRGDVERLVRILVARDPEGAALRWLEGQVRDQVRAGVHTLLEQNGVTGELARMLEDRLVRALVP